MAISSKGRNDENLEDSSPASDSAKPETSEKLSTKYGSKMESRRIRWRWDLRLGTLSLVAVLIIGAAGAASYIYHSASISATLYAQVEEAIESGDLKSQQRWLKRYLMLEPNDVDAVIQLALAADQAAEEAKRDERGEAIDRARQQLGNCIARLGESEGLETSISDLRSRLIERLLQLGGPWYVEAERQTLLMRASPDDALVAKWLALSLHGQFVADAYQERQPYLDTDDVDAWTRTSHLPIGEVLYLALDRNPGDLDLIAPYLEQIRLNPGLFDQAAESAARHQQKADEAIAELLARDDGRAKLVLYSYVRAGEEPERGKEVLLAAAPDASERLTQTSGELQDADGQGVVPDFVYDFRLLASAAGEIEPSDPDTALAWYSQLMEIKSALIEKEIYESIYIRVGFLTGGGDDIDESIKVWEGGLDVLGPSCVGLSGLIANARLYRDEDPKADDAVEAFREAVRMLRETYSRIERWQVANRERVGNQLLVASWRLEVADGLLALRRGDDANAFALLKKAFYSSKNVPLKERVRIGNLLADLALQSELWDRAASVFADTLELDPANTALRFRAAQAFERAGDRVQAMRLYRNLSQTNSILAKILSLQATFENECRQPQADRDFSGVRSALGQLESQIREVGDSAGNEAQEEANGSLAKRLACLRVKLPPPSVVFEEHLKSPGFVRSLLALAKLYPEDVNLQGFVAQQLMVAGSVDEANKVLAAISETLGEDDTAYVTIAARLDYYGGNPIAACERLEKQAELDAGKSAELFRSASVLAQAGSDPERGYRLLTKISELERSQKDMFDLAMFARGLPADSSLLNVNGQPVSKDELSSYWEEQIRKQTNDDSGYANWLEATKLIALLMKDPNGVDSLDPRVVEARILINQILKQRPRWGRAISLEGWILAAEKRHDEAVEQLRRGILAGDSSGRTRILLLEQLLAAGRAEEAQVEMDALPEAFVAAVDPYSAGRINISGIAGDFDNAIKIARKGVSERPKDYLSHLVLAQALLAVAQPDTDKREELLIEARSSIALASELGGDRNPTIFSIRIKLAKLEVSTRGFAWLEQEVAGLQQEIDTSSLDDYSKYVLKSVCLAALFEFRESAEMLLKADKLKQVASTQVKLAALYRKMGDADAEVDAMREAHRRDPDNANLRSRLAVLLAGRGGKQVDWRELSKLLAEEKYTSSSNRLLYSVLLATYGDAAQQENSANTLRELIAENNPRSDEARRVLAGLLIKQFEASGEAEDSIEGKRYVSEIMKLYSVLTQAAEASTVDVYRFANFLLSLRDDSLLPRIQGLITQLNTINGGIVQSLDLSLRYDERMGVQSAKVDTVEKWMQERTTKDGEVDAGAALVAGVKLINEGFVEEGLQWISKAYLIEPERRLRDYVLALSAAKETEKCVEICRKHYDEFKDTTSITFLAEALMIDPEQVDEEVNRVLEDAVVKHGKDSQLLESVATLRMLREEYGEAIPLFKAVLEANPFKIRSLNNLSMAYSQVPERAAEGLVPINLAIKFAGEVPELLDTKGTVLLAAGRLDEAHELFRELVATSSEPRYRFHLILTLLAQGKTSEAEESWQDLELENLKPDGLTAAERLILEQLKIDFAPTPKTS